MVTALKTMLSKRDTPVHNRVRFNKMNVLIFDAHF